MFYRIDPWANFDLNGLPTEKATRHRYNAVTKTWTLDEVIVKMDRKAFDRGAMRECYRM
jgi:elongation factor 2 kinase